MPSIDLDKEYPFRVTRFKIDGSEPDKDIELHKTFEEAEVSLNWYRSLPDLLPNTCYRMRIISPPNDPNWMYRKFAIKDKNA